MAVSTNLQQMQIARSKIYAGLISLGVPLAIFAVFGLLRAAAFSPQPAAAAPMIEIPPGIYERSQPKSSTDDEWAVPTAQPTIEADPGQDEIPFVLATDGHDANQDLDAFWEKRRDGLVPANPVPGCAPCAESPDATGFRTGNGGEAHTDIAQHVHVGQWAVDGYSTSSGMKGGR